VGESRVGSGYGARVEGLHAVEAAVEAGRVRRLWIEESRLADLKGLVASARGIGAEVEVVADLTEDAHTSSPQGVAADCVPHRSLQLRELVEVAWPPALLVCDHIQDPQNLGALARSALASGASGMVVPDRRSAPLSAAAFKAAAGALEHLPVVVVGSVAEALRAIKQLGVWTVGLAADGSDSLFGLSLLSEPVAVVLGQEQGGLTRLVRERVDVVARIPQDPKVESLNVSVAGALAMFEVMRIRSQQSGLKSRGSSSAPA
jgi:23S rRNA (guanosine2251-2'-O)-methyltransferase